MSTNTEKVNVATVQALRAGASPRDLEIARQYMGSKNYIGYCQKFVGQITGGRTSGASAIQAWNRAPQKVPGIQGLQEGDLVYFSPNASNKGYGHTGIYAGNGQFISATNTGIKQTNLLDWMKSTGQKFLGYVPGSQRQSSQLTFNPPTSQPVAGQMRKLGTQTQIPMPPTPEETKLPVVNLNPNQGINNQYA